MTRASTRTKAAPAAAVASEAAPSTPAKKGKRGRPKKAGDAGPTQAADEEGAKKVMLVGGRTTTQELLNIKAEMFLAPDPLLPENYTGLWAAPGAGPGNRP